MSKIEKLSIRGIRSFSPNEEAVIYFATPLTLIVGHNGAGKTTIIECLKYATTGDLPPGSSGGAFIFDPKSETKARIKLRFVNVGGDKMVCSRAMILQVKSGGKMTQKTLEGMLSMINDAGEQVSLGKKCAQLDSEMPFCLGVSKAVLENVIFCHQEESFWPLSEPGNLKKKFDDIFSSTKYSKALDNLKSIRKEQFAELKPLQQNMEHLKADREKAKKLRDNMNRVIKEIDHQKGRISELDSEIKQVYNEIDESIRLQQLHASKIQTLDQKKHEEKMLRQLEQDLRSNIHIMEESDDQLENMLKQQLHVLNNADEVEANHLNDKRVCEKRIEDIQKSITKLAEQRGKFQSDHEANENLIKIRNEKIKELARVYGFHLSDDFRPEESEITRFYVKLTDEKTAAEQKLSEEQKRFKLSENDLMNKIQILISEKKSAEDLRYLKRKSKQENVRRISEIISELNKIRSDGESIDSLKTSIADKEDDLKRSKENFTKHNFDSIISKCEKEKDEIESKLSELKDEMANVSKSSDTRAKLRFKTAERTKKESARAKLFDSCSVETKSHFNVELTPENMIQELNDLKKSKDERKLKLQTALDKATFHSKDVAMHLSIVTADIESREKRLEDIRVKISSKWKNDDISKLYNETEREIIEVANSLSMLESAGSAYEKFRDDAKKNHCCPLCDRDFQSKSVFDDFMKKMSDHIENSPQITKDLKEKVNSLRVKKDELARNLPLWTEKNRLLSELSDLKQNQTTLQAENENSSTDLEDRQDEYALMEVDLQMMDSMLNKSLEYDRLSKEIKHLEDEIREISDELRYSGSVRSVEEVQGDIDSLNEREKSIRKNIEKTTNERQMRQNDIIMKEKRLNDAKIQIFQLEKSCGDVDRLQSEKNRLSESNQNLDDELEAFEKRLQHNDPLIKELENEKSILQSTHSKIDTEIRGNISTITQNIVKIEEMTKEIDRYRDGGFSLRLGEVEESIQKLQAEIETESKKLRNILSIIQNSHQNVAELRVQERNIRDNLRLRKVSHDLSTFTLELKQMIELFDVSDTDRIKETVENLNKRVSVLNGERSALEGSMQQLKLQKTQMKTDLSEDYEDIENFHRKAVIELGTEQKGVSDLDKYIKAIDAAIMKYHSVKMEEINRSIKELWMKTYKGDDIDTIEIRSEPETSRGNRTYNYRVVLVKGDVVLDMRGRCSAGQKVLACIIIRLALAESFCHHCGILALDEPTTNLDEDNITSLSQSLAEIIDVRQNQSNFQLLIITHDEKFLQYLNHHAENYYRVSKDPNGFSKIEQVEMGN